MKINFHKGHIEEVDVSLLASKLKEGKSIVITGPNKSGKTMFMVHLFGEIYKEFGDKLLPTCGENIIHNSKDVEVPYSDELELFTFLNEHRGKIIAMDEPYIMPRSVGLLNALINKHNQFIVCVGKEKNYKDLLENEGVSELIVTVRIGVDSITLNQRYYEIIE